MNEFDLIVVGAGPGGTAAAIAAGRRGVKTLLVEKHGMAGGMATAGLVNPFAGHFYLNPQTGRTGSLIEGLFAEICQRLRKRSAILRFYRRGEDGFFFDGFDDAWLRVIYDELLSEAGVETLYHAQLLDVQTGSDGIESVRILAKEGLLKLAATSYIDSTGDADLVVAAGGAYKVGRDEDGLCQPCSMMFRMGGVNKKQLQSQTLYEYREMVNSKFREAKAAGRIVFPSKDSLNIYDFPRPGVLHFNATRVLGRPALDSSELTRVEIEGRKQVAILSDWLRAEVPGFERSFVESVASHVGIRETRRILGKYIMSRDDVTTGARFHDGIARSGYFIDIHNPIGPGGLHSVTLGSPLKKGFDVTEYYEIPYGSLVPEKLSNVLVACRAFSTDHYAHAATRVMATITSVGEAAGIGVAIAGRKGIQVSKVNGVEVRAEIGYLDAPLPF